MGEAFIRKNNRIDEEREIVVLKDGLFQADFGYETPGTTISFKDGYIVLTKNVEPGPLIHIRPLQLFVKRISKISVTASTSGGETVAFWAFDPDGVLICGAEADFPGAESWKTIDAEGNGRVLSRIQIYASTMGRLSFRISDISLFVEETL